MQTLCGGLASPLPLWERVASRSDSAGEPGEGSVLQMDADLSPALARLRLRSGTLSHKGRGEEKVLHGLT